MKYTEKYILRFRLDHPITLKELKIIKGTLGYKQCELADASHDIFICIIEELKINKFIENIKCWLKI